MTWPALTDARSLADSKGTPCVSIYLPLRSAFTASLENARRYGQAVVRAADWLDAAGTPAAQVGEWAARLASVEQQMRGRGPAPQGVSVFLDAAMLRCYRLTTPPTERVVVADCFSLRELIRQIELRDGNHAGPRPPPREQLVLELDRILAAAQRGAIRRLWTREGAVVPGHFDPETGRIVAAPPGACDVLDGLTASVLRSGGDVRVAAVEDMPGAVHTAAEFA